MEDPLADIRRSWDQKAADWRTQVGDHGDRNRRLNSDPVLHELLGPPKNLTILDVGCGTGYLTAQLDRAGATVRGTDLSPEMIRIARESYPGLDFRVDDCGILATVPDASLDAVLFNYVLMDTPDLDAALRTANRVLKPAGIVIAIFSHPCFPQGRAHAGQGVHITYEWTHSYFLESQQRDPPWAHFTSEFLWYHRPLSVYWKAFRDAGFTIEELREPCITPERHALAPDAKTLHNAQHRPYSIAFRLRKPA